MTARRFVLGALLCLVLGSTTFAAPVDLKIENVQLDPQPAVTAGQRIQLGTWRSYRIVVTIKKTTDLPKGKSFVVRTECIRNGKGVIVGEARVGDSKGWFIYATYDLYPAEAGSGDCLLRTTIDADNEMKESDESAISNIWDRNATLVSP